MERPFFVELGPGHTLGSLIHSAQSTVGKSPLLQAAPLRDGKPANAFRETVASLWAEGGEVQWSKMRSASSPRKRVCLPTYPFQTKRFWVDADFNSADLTAPHPVANSPQSKATAGATEEGSHSDSTEDWFYRPLWKQIAPVLQTEAPSRERWLLVGDKWADTQKLAQQLEADGDDVICVSTGDSFASAGFRRHTVRASESADFQSLFDELKLRDTVASRIVRVWTPTESVDDLAAGFPFLALLALAQAIGAKTTEPLALSVITRHAVSVFGTEPHDWRMAELCGLCQVIGQEFPHVTTRVIDSDLIHSPASWARRLVDEMRAETSEAVVAFRGHHRWVREFEPYCLPAKPKSEANLRGVYFVVGDANSPLAKIVDNGLRSIEGSQVVALPFPDVGKQQTLRDVLGQAAEEHGMPQGIFCVGPTTNPRSAAPLAILGEDHYHYNRTTKVDIALELTTAIADWKTDFVCVQSSMSSILGGIGLAAYSGANHALDQIVHHHYDATTRWLVINWDRIELESAPDA
ncbi:MAG: KR domain-containing protein, partial [Planctomycetota bacterium]